MRKSNGTVPFISWNQRPHVLTMNCSFYLKVCVLTLASAHFQLHKLSFFFTFHVYLWIDYYCQIPSLALLAELNTYSKVTAVTGRRWVFLWKPFLPHISKCISLIYCHMLVKPCFKFFSWHMLLQNLDCSLGGSYNCSPHWLKEGFPAIMEYCGQNTGNGTWCLTRTLGKITKLCNYINMQSADDSPTVSVTVRAALRNY